MRLAPCMMTAMSLGPEFSQRPRHGLLSILCALFVALAGNDEDVALGCVALAQACAQATVEATATLSVALDAADLGGGAGPTPDDRDAPHAGTDVLQALGACMVALTDVVALIAARRAPALVAVLSAPRGTHTLMRFTACAVRRGATPPHALCVIRV